MIPRAVEQIFAYCTALESKGWRYTLDAMYLEIFNESINDLLADCSSAQTVHEVKHHGVGAQAGKEPQVMAHCPIALQLLHFCYTFCAQVKRVRKPGSCRSTRIRCT
jgi:hypothetical protein